MAPGQDLQADRWSPACGPFPGLSSSCLQAISAGSLGLPQLVHGSVASMTGLRLCSIWDLGLKLLCHAQPVKCQAAAPPVQVLPCFHCAGAGGLSRDFQHKLSAFLRELNTKLGGRKLVAAHFIKIRIVVMQVNLPAASVMAMWQMAPAFVWVFHRMASGLPALSLVAKGVAVYILHRLACVNYAS